MANEFQLLPNPDNVPGQVTSGYQRQNVNMYAIQTGIDTTEPYDDGAGIITIPAGGVVEVNGSLFKLASDITLEKPVTASAYWIVISDNEDGTASASLVERPGEWKPGKQGCYLGNSDNRRTLNWVSLGDLQSPPSSGAEFSQAVKGTWKKLLRKGWYYLIMQSGKGGGSVPGGSPDGAGWDASGQFGTGSRNGSGGGGSPYNSRLLVKIFFDDGKKVHEIKVGGDGLPGSDGADGADSAGGGSSSGTPGGKGGGGGAGGGEESCFDDLTTGHVSGTSGGGGGSAGGTLPAGRGGPAGSNGEGAGGNRLGGRAGGGFLGGGGGGAGTPSNNGASDATTYSRGGDGGDGGDYVSDGQPGGFCRVYLLTN